MEFNFDRGMSVWYFRNSFVEGDSTQKVFFVKKRSIFTMNVVFLRWSSCCLVFWLWCSDLSSLLDNCKTSVVKFRSVPFKIWRKAVIGRSLFGGRLIAAHTDDKYGELPMHLLFLEAPKEALYWKAYPENPSQSAHILSNNQTAQEWWQLAIFTG